jgi:CheY-like chemotaxis protein
MSTHESAGDDMLESDDPAGEVERLVNLIVTNAAKAGASDVHVEPNEAFLQVRQRVDGLLHEVLTVPHHLQDQIISRLKIISGMDVAERGKPQDGRCRLLLEGSSVDLRVSTVPTQFGEKVVIWLLDADRAVVPIDELGPTPENLRGRPDTPPGDRRRVLVVEDNATIVTVVKYFLELEGFEVIVAEDGLAGHVMAVRECPDVIVSDIRMPGMGGLEMVKALRLNPRTADVRVLMLTSDASVESETELLAAGADDYIVKPVEPRRLAARVKALLTRSRPTTAPSARARPAGSRP